MYLNGDVEPVLRRGIFSISDVEEEAIMDWLDVAMLVVDIVDHSVQDVLDSEGCDGDAGIGHL